MGEELTQDIEIELDPNSDGPEIIIQRTNGTNVLVDPKWAVRTLKRWVVVCVSAVVAAIGAYTSLV